eukprot:m.113651 g.113651  ORF g.113651 m.113651 type:complete len:409 (+) comp19323_c0_seq1:193-1419(+)
MNNIMTEQANQPETTQVASQPSADEELFAPVRDFEMMGLTTDLLRGIYAFGFETPSEIQARSILPAKSGRDCILQAQSGTGKTGAFSVAVLSQVDFSQPDCQAILLSPCRELALQTDRIIRCLGDYTGVKSHVLVGGRSVREDIIALAEEGNHVVCGTPGRVFDMISRGKLDTRHVRCFVLDEADVLLDQGFTDQIYDIFRTLPKDVQVLLVSATLNGGTLQVANKLLRNPVKVLLEQSMLKLEGIRHYYVGVDRDDQKLSVMEDLYESLSVNMSIIFVNTKRRAELLAAAMRENDFSVAVITSEQPQAERETIMKKFFHGQSRVLIATDLLARGIDVQQVSTVINFDLPNDPANYVHRVGRGGRFGRKSVTVNLVTPACVRKMREIESYLSLEIPELPADIAATLAH